VKAMILAAGRGERLRPLSDTTPKPLLKIGDKCLIEYHLTHLALAGFKQVVINTAWLGQQIRDTLGNGNNYNLDIVYSDESEQVLETAGGIINALPLLGKEPFLVINADIWTDYDFKELVTIDSQAEAHLILIPNPAHNPNGDFSLDNGRTGNTGNTMYTFSGMGIYKKSFFNDVKPGKIALAPLLRARADEGLVTGSLFEGDWADVGTMERLNELNATIKLQ